MNDNQLHSLKSLWAELLLIDSARHPEYLIQCWHAADGQRCFSDARCRILTRALDGNRRICRFTEDDLRPEDRRRTLIASTFVIPSASGKTVYDLRDSILSKVVNSRAVADLNAAFNDSIRGNEPAAASFRADVLLARELLQFHDIAAIPDIPAPNEDTGILTLDITDLDPIDTASYDTSTSPLFRSAMMR